MLAAEYHQGPKSNNPPRYFRNRPFRLDDELNDELDDGLHEENTDTASHSIFFSRTAIATAFVGVALAVTAYFSAPIALATTLALGVTGLAYYGITTITESPQQNPADSECLENTEETDDIMTQYKERLSSSYGHYSKLLPHAGIPEYKRRRTTPGSNHEDTASQNQKAAIRNIDLSVDTKNETQNSVTHGI